MLPLTNSNAALEELHTNCFPRARANQLARDDTSLGRQSQPAAIAAFRKEQTSPNKSAVEAQ